jgi:hypothetical protein
MGIMIRTPDIVLSFCSSLLVDQDTAPLRLGGCNIPNKEGGLAEPRWFECPHCCICLVVTLVRQAIIISYQLSDSQVRNLGTLHTIQTLREKVKSLSNMSSWETPGPCVCIHQTQIM